MVYGRELLVVQVARMLFGPSMMMVDVADLAVESPVQPWKMVVPPSNPRKPGSGVGDVTENVALLLASYHPPP